MNKKTIYTKTGIILGTLILGIIIGRLIFPDSGGHRQDPEGTVTAEIMEAAA